MTTEEEILDTLKKLLANQEEQLALSRKAVATQDWFKGFNKKLLLALVVLAVLAAALSAVVDALNSN